VQRCAEMARVMIESSLGEGALVRGGRKGHRLEPPVQRVTGPGEYEPG
jgi:hypothetical protein